MPKGFSFIVPLFDITLKLTQQASKNCRHTRRVSERRKRQSSTLIIHSNQDPLDTPKICFDTFRPVNVVNSDLNHSFTSNLSAITRFPLFRKWSSLTFFQVSCPLNSLYNREGKNKSLPLTLIVSSRNSS